MVFTLFRMGFSLGIYPTDRLYYHATDKLTMGIALSEICQAVHAVWSCVYVTLLFLVDLYMNIGFNECFDDTELCIR